MTDPDPPTDHDGGADATDSAGSGRDGAAGRDSGAGTETQATPRLANAPDGDTDSEDRSVADPGALREPEPIEPESLRAENTLFVLLGALGTVALLATAVVPGLL
jgi:hypothetical protein